MPINQEREKRQQQLEKIDMTIIHKHKMRQNMWEDYAATDPTNRFSEARGGREQDGVTHMK
jgi:hypothetical protein